jgi:ATP-dependent exoDNAse (exonuclease V) beta subunit
MQEIIRLAHVAVTRARDRLYITGHRYAEGSADASSYESLMASLLVPRPPRIFCTPCPKSIALPNDEAVLSRFDHAEDYEVESAL